MAKSASKQTSKPSGKRTAAKGDRRTIRVMTAGAKGGPGKSFLAKNLSAAAAQEGLSVTTVDFDTQRTLSKWIRRRAAHQNVSQITNYEADPSSVQDAVWAVSFNDCDIMFIDTPPSIDHHPEAMKVLAQGVDLLLIPSKVGISDTESAQELLVVLEEWGAPTLIVLNLVKVMAKKYLEKAKRRLIGHAELSAVEIPDYIDFLMADEAGLGATEVTRCNGADAIDAVWMAVKRRVALKTAGRA